MTTPVSSPRGSRTTWLLRGGLRILGPLLLLVVAGSCGGEGELEQPTPLYGEEPIAYPVELWDEGAEGTTLLRVRVNETGVVDSVEVLESSGHEGLDAAALTGARELRFQPGRKDGKRIRMWASLPVHFSKRPRTNDDS